MGPLEAAIERKGEGASFATITPTEFHYDFRELDWINLALGLAGTAALSVGVVAYTPFVAGAGIATTFAAGLGSYAAVAATGFVGGAAASTVDAVEDWINSVRTLEALDYEYIKTNYRLFTTYERFDMVSSVLGKYREKLIEKEQLENYELSFYKFIKDNIKDYPGENASKIIKNLTIILDWLFVLNGVTSVQTGNSATILDRYSKESMIADISIRVDAMLKEGFKLNDTSDFRAGLGFRKLTTPTIAQRGTFGFTSQALVFPQLIGVSKIASDDLETAAKNIVANIGVMNSSDSKGMKKYASLIGLDLTNNVIIAKSGVTSDTMSRAGYGNSTKVDYKFKYNGEEVNPEGDWLDEEGASREETRRAVEAIQDTNIKVPSGLNQTSVVSFGKKFDVNTLNQTTTYEERSENGEVTGTVSREFEGLEGIPQPGANIGEVIQSLIDSAYAFFVAELGQNAYNNADINQKTLYDESVIYYSEIIARLIGTVINNVQKFYLYAEFSALFAQGKDVTPEAVAEAQLVAQQAASNAAANIATGGGLDASLEITDEQLKNRQKFVKQCILMYNMDSLRTEYRTYIKSKTETTHPIHGGRPFGGRFHAIEDTDSQNTNTINKMIVPKGKEMTPLLEITPDIHAFLVPKIRLFRVVHRVSEPGLIETEFDFRKTEHKERIEGLMNAKYDKGNSYGIKSFDFSFEGTNPATARNDIVANLSLHFQSFQDFIKERTSASGEKYQFVDLIIFPVNKKNRKGIGTLRAEEYDPSIYRIRAEVGWMVPEKHSGLNEVLVKRGMTYDQLKKALILTNKSFYLNMVDHNFSIKDDGTVDITISYRAYIESALKSTKFDALTTPQLRKNREKFKETMLVVLQKDNCSNEEIKTIKELFKKAEEETIKKVYRSLLLRLNQSNSIFFVDANVNDIKQFRRDGFFSRGLAPRLETARGEVLKQVSTVQDMQEKAKEESEFGGPTLKLLQDGVKDYPDENMKEDNRINFFYLGDLIYTILDNMYDEQGNQNIDMNKTKLLLSSFSTFGAFGGDNGTQNKSFNIVDIPVSVEYFYEWFTQNVIKPKKLYYPMMDFIRDLTNNLVVNLLFDSCGQRPIDTKMRFNTGNFILLGNGENSNVDPFSDWVNSAQNFPVIDLAKYYGNGLPLLSDKEGEKDINDFFNYIAIYPITTTVVHPGRGSRFEDENKGIYHFQIGSSKGLVKKIKLAKTDTQYLREARFFRNGIDGLMQLSAVYKATLTMIGNTIYYPGMDLYIDPVGIGGPEFNPSNKESLAYKTGIGGYHLVTRVKSAISPGKFETTVDALWHNSGAGTGRFAGRPDMSYKNEGAKPDNEQPTLDTKPKDGDSSEIDVTTKCTPLVSAFENYLAQTESSTTPVEFNPDLSAFEETENNSSNDVQPQETLIDPDGNPTDEFSQNIEFPESEPDDGFGD